MRAASSRRRLGHDGPHLAGGRDQARLAGGPLPRRARRRAKGLQLVRLATRQPRGHGARHVRKRPAPQPARSRLGRDVDGALPSGEEMTIFEAAERYRAEGTPLVVLAGKEYGSGSSRDWAAKGPEAPRRACRDRGELRADPPLEPAHDGRPPAAVHAGREPRVARPERARGVLDHGPRERRGRARSTVRADDKEFRAIVRLDTPREREYLRHGGILPFVLRRLLAA